MSNSVIAESGSNIVAICRGHGFTIRMVQHINTQSFEKVGGDRTPLVGMATDRPSVCSV